MQIKLLFVPLISIIVVSFHMLHAAPGETEGITLIFPSGVRQNAMGETGTALADDENLLFFNPAGLARDNNRLKRGAFSYTYENLLPLKEVDNVWPYEYCYSLQTRESINWRFWPEYKHRPSAT